MKSRTRTTTIACAGLLLLLPGGTCYAQRIEPVALTSRAVREYPAFQAPREPINAGQGVVVGLLGGVVGLVAGFFAGATIETRRGCEHDLCGLAGGILGAAIGESIGLSIGTHYGARGNANPVLTSLAVTGIGVAGLAVAFAAENNGAAFILALTPIIQLAVALGMER